MEYISLNPTTIVTPDTAKPPGSKATSNYWAEQTKPASILRIRFYHETKAHDRGFQVVYDELIEKHSTVGKKYTGWKLVTAWTGAIVASWALVIGCVVIARALLP
jgi:hypothetical protein